MTEKIKAIPKWETDVRERLKNAVKKYSKPLADLIARDANEGDTRLIVTDFLCDALGYDKYSDLTTEYRVKGEFADFGIRLDHSMFAFIEVKRVTTKLNEKHLRQVETYAVNEGCEWIILTNGNMWQLYHITANLPMIVDLALQVELLSDESPAKKIDHFFYLTKEAFKKNLITAVWEAKRAASPKSLAKILCSDSVIDSIRKEIKRQTNQAMENKDILKLISETVIRAECLEK